MKAPLPPDEETRLEALHRYHILDTAAEDVYDNLARLAAHLCGVPICAVSLVDEDREWFKASVGLAQRQTPRQFSFCAHAILEQGITTVDDLGEDPRFADYPQVKSPDGIRFYAGAPLVTPEGHALGTLCVMDRKPRHLAPEQSEALQALSRHVLCQMEMRHAADGQALVLASLDQARRAADEANGAYESAEAAQGYQETRFHAATYMFETVPHKAYLSSDVALARFYGYKTLEEMTSLLSDI